MGATPDKDESSDRKLAGLVVFGSSSGGIDAVLTIVASLPSDFPAPIVIAQHLDPQRESRLGELLARRTDLTVRTVTSDVSLEAGTIYVVPSDRDVEISDHHVGVHKDTAGLSRPSVDRLMSTAARVFGDDLIGVVLSGTGTDGAAGAQAIKGYGGTVIVQNPQSAEYSGMPMAVPPSAVDVVAELDAIGPLLVDLLSGHFSLPPPGQDDELRTFLAHVRDKSGLDFRSYKRPTIERRLQRRMVAVGAITLSDYRQYVESHPDEMQRLVASFLIKVTRFFRDPDLYDHLREHVLPPMISEARKRGELRLWSAGCATGEEAYTLAMLVTDILADTGGALPVRIFATDIATDAVDFARHGVYPESAVADMPPDMVERHFVEHNATYEVSKKVRSLVVFGVHDLSRRAPFPRIDLVLCRNVLIYFTPELQRRSLQSFAFSLRQNGYLVLGKAESVSPLPEFFALEHPRLKIFRRVGAPAPIPVERMVDASAGRSTAMPTGQRTHIPQLKSSAAERSPSRSTVSQIAPFLDTLSTGVIIVDRNYDIQAINVRARQLLGIVGAGIGKDLVHGVVPGLAEPVRKAIDTAFRGESTTSVHQVPEDIVDDGNRDLSISCTPARAEGDNDPIDAVVLEVMDVTRFAQNERHLVQERDEAREENIRLQQRATAAITEVRELRKADNAMAAEQGRLRAENEQLQLASEEAQAAAEEIETLNEEQQATNEELETLNEELQATVEELNTTNADLQSRAIEQEALAATLAKQRADIDSERARLEAILANMADAVLVVDAEGNAVETNSAWERLLGPIEEFAPENDAGDPLPVEVWPHQRAIAGEAFTLQFSLNDPEGNRRWFEAHSQPVQPGRDGALWGVVVVRDITERSLRRMQQRFLAVASHELRTPMTSLSGSLQLLARRIPDGTLDARMARHVTRAQEQMRRLEILIGELTDVSRLQGGMFRLDRAPVDLETVVHKAMDSAHYFSEGQEVRIDTPSEPLLVDGDAYRLEQVVLNLIINAFRHAKSPQGVDIRLRRVDDTAIMEVQDYGPGVAEDAMQEIFSQFYQSQNDARMSGGFGLGLFIAREIVTAHDGTIEVKSAPGEGSTFEIRLPLLDEGSSAPDEATSQESE